MYSIVRNPLYLGDDLALRVTEERGYLVVFAVAAVAFLTVRALKKHTGLLLVPGR